MTDAVATAIYAMGLDPAAYARGAASVAQANDKVLDGLDKVATAEGKVEKATLTTADAFTRLEAKYDPLIRAEQRRQAALAAANRYLEEGTVTQARYEAQVSRINAFYNQGAGANDNATASVNRFRGTLQNAGYQVGDFAVQLASGQNGVVAFTQQAGQLLGSFGMWGAVLGAAASIAGAVAINVFKMGESAKDAEKAQKNLNAAVDEGNRLLLTKNELEKRGNVKGVLDAQIGDFGEKLALEKEIDRLTKARDAQQAKLDATKGQSGPGVDNAREKYRGDIGYLNDQINEARFNVATLDNQISDLFDPSKIGNSREFVDQIQTAIDSIDPEEFKTQVKLENEYFIAAVTEALDEVSEKVKKTNDAWANSIANALRSVDDQMERRNAGVEKYIAGLENSSANQNLPKQERETQTALLEAQNRLVDDQGNKVRDLTALERGRVEQAIKVKNEVEQHKALMTELGNAAERSFDRIGAGITQIALTGKMSLLDMKNIGLAVVSELAQEFLKLAAINPIKNAVFGGMAPTLGGAAMGGLFGSVSGWFTDMHNTGVANSIQAPFGATDNSLWGFADGGSFTVGGTGGTDSQVVSFKASPDEQITVETPSQRRAGMSGGGLTVHYSPTIDARGADASVLPRLGMLLERNKKETVDLVFSTMRKGGREAKVAGLRD